MDSFEIQANQGTQPLVLTRLIPVHSANTRVSREHLTNEFLTSIKYKIIVMQGAPGSGKTSFLYDCYNALSQDRYEKLWLTVDGVAVNYENIKFYILYALSTILPCPEIENLKTQTFTDNEMFLLALSNVVYLCRSQIENKEIVLFIDSMEKIELHKVVQFFNSFCSYMPQNFHLVVTQNYFSRSLIKADFRNFVHVFQKDSLNLTKDEILDLSESYAPNLLSEDLLNELLAYTRGWALAVSVYIEALAHNELLQTDYLDKDALNNLVHSFFSDCVDSANITSRDTEFLVETSLLTRCNASLCNFILSRQDSQVTLDKLVQLNLFIDQDPKQMGWYTIQPVFSRWLRNKLMEIRLDSIRQLASLASVWFERDGQELEAVKFLLLSSDFDYIKNLSAPLSVMRENSNIKFFMNICEMPAKEIKSNVFTAMFVMWAYLCAGRPKELLAWLNIFMDNYHKSQGQTILFDDRHILFYFDESVVNLINTYVHIKCEGLIGNYEYVIEQHERILSQIQDQIPHALLCIIIYDLAEAYQYLGNFDQAEKHYMEAQSLSELAHSTFFTIFSCLGYCWIKILTGKYVEAEQVCRKSLKMCPPDFSLYGALNTALSMICIKSGRLDEADTCLRRAKKRLSKSRNLDMYFEMQFVEANYLHARGQQKDAFNLATKLILEVGSCSLPRGVNFLGNTIYARILFDMGYYDKAFEVADNMINAAQDNQVIYLRGKLLHSWIDYKQGHLQKVLNDTESLIAKAIQYDLVSDEMSARALRVLTLQELNQSGQAKKELNRLLNMAEQNKEIDVFMQAGETMRVLLHEILNTRKSTWSTKTFVRSILQSFGDTTEGDNVSDAVLDFNLTERESEILELLNLGMSRKEIAQSLSISLNTVKTHVAHIYEKLGVDNRIDAFKQTH